MLAKHFSIFSYLLEHSKALPLLHFGSVLLMEGLRREAALIYAVDQILRVSPSGT